MQLGIPSFTFWVFCLFQYSEGWNIILQSPSGDIEEVVDCGEDILIWGWAGIGHWSSSWRWPRIRFYFCLKSSSSNNVKSVEMLVMKIVSTWHCPCAFSVQIFRPNIATACKSNSVFLAALLCSGQRVGTHYRSSSNCVIKAYCNLRLRKRGRRNPNPRRLFFRWKRLNWSCEKGGSKPRWKWFGLKRRRRCWRGRWV